MKPKINIVYINKLLYIYLILLILGFIYSIWNIGKYNHFDEWVGRGLYPGIALAKGFDLYEPTAGPHVTSYGWTSALFYSPTGFWNNPSNAIFCAYILNIIGFTIVIFIILCVYTQKNSLLSKGLLILISLTVISIAQFDSVTSSISKIHSDVPASLFLIAGLILSCRSKCNSSLFLASILLIFAVMAKLPVLPALLTPFMLYLKRKEYKTCISFLILIIIALGLSFIPVYLFFGINDFMYYHENQTNTWGWVDRYDLFNGEGANILKLSYIEAFPILVRFFLMYVECYWFLFFPNLIIFSHSLKGKNLTKNLIFSLSLAYFLTLPACLAALAHWGAWHNALFICNILSLISIASFTYYILVRHFIISGKFTLLFSFSCISSIVLLISLRYSKNAPDVDNSPYEQAYNYLQKGNKDIYFGWYPIPHALYDGSNYTSLEVPIWVGMARNYNFSFDRNHFPKDANIFATGRTGYGSTSLKPYLGSIKEIQAPPELSNWRLFSVKD